MFASFIPHMNKFWTKLLLIVCECEFPMETFVKCFLCAQLKLLLPRIPSVGGLILPTCGSHTTNKWIDGEWEGNLVEFQSAAANFCFENVLIMNDCLCVSCVCGFMRQWIKLSKTKMFETVAFFSQLKLLAKWQQKMCRREHQQKENYKKKWTNNKVWEFISMWFPCMVTSQRAFCRHLDKGKYKNYKWFFFYFIHSMYLPLCTC